jgi:cell division septation protein DedD
MVEQEQKDTEIILGTGKLLAIFFALVAICGTFFGLGYTLGRSSSPMALQSGATMLVSSPGAKPGAGVTVTAAPVAQPEPVPGPNSAADTNTTASAQTDQTPSQNASAAPATADTASSDSPKPATAAAPVVQNTTAPELVATTGNITVQVAAVTKEEDAQALVTALRRKNYPVFVPPNPSTDNLYHVQVGPFAELKDAEAMKAKLAGDGYNAIVKK